MRSDILLSLTAKLFGVQCNVDSIRHSIAVNISAEMSPLQLNKALQKIGLKTKIITQSIPSLKEKKNYPRIVFNANGEFLLLLKGINDDQILCADGLSESPMVMTAGELLTKGFEKAILLTKRQQSLSETTKFGFSWFFQAIKKYKIQLFDVIVASFFLQLLGLATPIFFQTVLDKVVSNQSYSTLNVLAIGFSVVILVEFGLSMLRNYLMAHTANRVDVTLGSMLYRHLVHLPISFFDARRVGHTVARVRELESVREFITSSALTLCIDAFFTIVFFAVMFYYSITLGLIVLLSVPLYFIIAAVITPIFRKKLDEKFLYGAENQAYLVESVSGINTLKSKALEPVFSERWDEKLAAFTKTSFEVALLANWGSNLSQLVSKIVTVCILWFGTNAVLAGEITLGQLIAVNVLAGRVSGPILRIAQLWQDFQQIHISTERLGEILNLPTEERRSGDSSLPTLQGDIEFKNVQFAYTPNTPPVLNQVNFKVSPGTVVGIVGRSGSGKSSLTKLIQRLYIPQQGQVLIDGLDLRNMDVAWLRQKIGVVLQENFLFSDSIRNNIAVSDLSVSDDAVVTAAKLAGAHDFITKLPNGYSTVLGENGCGLSGGQKQRIAIARALISNPQILIFDEATSALDYESEAVIQQNMADIVKGRTVFIIAHRLSTVKNADVIFVMEHGKIVESGNHAELMRIDDGYYKKLSGYQSMNHVDGV